MDPTPIYVLVVDDHPMIRAGIAASLGSEIDIKVVASASNGEEALQLFRNHQPDITLMDLMMPGMGGVAAIRAIRNDFPAAKIIVLSTYQGDEDIYRALEAGAATYLLKDTLADELLLAIREVAAGRRHIPSVVAQRLAERILWSPLTPRELEVLRLVAAGKRNKEVARVLRISDETAQAHVRSILDKLQVHDRTEAVAIALRRGIIHLD